MTLWEEAEIFVLICDCAFSEASLMRMLNPNCLCVGHSADPGMCGRPEQQRVALSCPECHGTGPDDDPGHVEQGLLPQAAPSLHL